MSKRSDEQLLKDIVEAMERIMSYTHGLEYSDFLRDLKTQDAVVRNIEIIGEAVNKISLNLKREHENIPWKEMNGIRNRLIHEYFGVNFDIVWAVVSEDLPRVLPLIKKIVGK
jgi:uncharacterized protein with HEPN domain